jgi:hypothetical protein
MRLEPTPTTPYTIDTAAFVAAGKAYALARPGARPDRREFGSGTPPRTAFGSGRRGRPASDEPMVGELETPGPSTPGTARDDEPEDDPGPITLAAGVT